MPDRHPHDRGRSRTISPAALARRASEERRRAAPRPSAFARPHPPRQAPRVSPALAHQTFKSAPPTPPPPPPRRLHVITQVSPIDTTAHRQELLRAQQRATHSTLSMSLQYNRDFVQGSSSDAYSDNTDDDDDDDGDARYESFYAQRINYVRYSRPLLPPQPRIPEPEPEREEYDDMEDDGCYCEGRIELDEETEALLREGIRRAQEKEAAQEKERQMRARQIIWEAESQKARAAKITLVSNTPTAPI